MAIARTGVFVDDYLECEFLSIPITIPPDLSLCIYIYIYVYVCVCVYIYPLNFKFEFGTDASTLPAELQRLLNTIRELDERSQGDLFPFLNHFTCICVFMQWIFFVSGDNENLNSTILYKQN